MTYTWAGNLWWDEGAETTASDEGHFREKAVERCNRSRAGSGESRKKFGSIGVMTETKIAGRCGTSFQALTQPIQ